MEQNVEEGMNEHLKEHYTQNPISVESVPSSSVNQELTKQENVSCAKAVPSVRILRIWSKSS